MTSRMKGLEKAPYGKPTVSRVPLRPEESVLTACKVGGTRGPSSYRLTCLSGFPPTQCQFNSPT
jgi:hypothetical protein